MVLYNGDKESAIRATISICIEQGKLVRYLSEHRREVEDYMFALLSDEELKEAYGDYRHKQGVKEGLEQGLEQGKDRAFDIFKRLISGESREEILKSGVPAKDIEAAEELIKKAKE